MCVEIWMELEYVDGGFTQVSLRPLHCGMSQRGAEKMLRLKIWNRGCGLGDISTEHYQLAQNSKKCSSSKIKFDLSGQKVRYL